MSDAMTQMKQITRTTTSHPNNTPWSEMFVNLHLAYTQLTRTQQDLERRSHEIEETHDLLQLVIESMTEALFLLDPSGRIMRANPGAATLLERDVTTLEGAFFSDVGGTDDLPATAWQFLDSGYAETSNRIEAEVRSLSGRTVAISASCELVRDKRGKIVGLLIVAEDITERKQAEVALREKAAELARSNTELEQYAYVVSHDLQEPLRMISSFTQLLADSYRGRLDEEADEYVHFILDGARRMRMLIRDLLSYSRVGTRGKAFAPTDCSAIFESVCISLNETIRESGATVTADKLPVVEGDESQLTQLFQNLVANAIKFRCENRPVEVRVSVTRRMYDWLFTVRDNGIGIEQEQADRIFSIFQRLHTMEEYPGTGIGLAICKKIVERHNGQIWVESELNRGSTFYFTIPYSHSDGGPDEGVNS